MCVYIYIHMYTYDFVVILAPSRKLAPEPLFHLPACRYLEDLGGNFHCKLLIFTGGFIHSKYIS